MSDRYQSSNPPTGNRESLDLKPYRVTRKNGVYYVEKKILFFFWVPERGTFPTLESAISYIDSIRPVDKEKFEYWY